MVKVPYELTENVNVTYIDDTTGKTLETKSLSGAPNTNSQYSTKDTIDKYVANNYVLISDPTDQKNIFYDNDEKPDVYKRQILKLLSANIEIEMKYMSEKKYKRQNQIVLLLNRTGFMTSTSLAEQIGVTPMTIRRDINELDKQHKLIKTFGGAKPISNVMTVEFSTSQKLKINVDLKKQIGQKLAEIIDDNSTIFLGAGTTLLYAVPYLVKKNLTFVTNSFISFSRLATSDCRVPVSYTHRSFLNICIVCN